MATEIAIFPLRAGKRPDDASSGPGQVLKDTLDTLTEQPGFQRAYWGREVENPDTFRLFVDWDSVDAHIEFTKKELVLPMEFCEQNVNLVAVITSPSSTVSGQLQLTKRPRSSTHTTPPIQPTKPYLTMCRQQLK